MKDLATGLAVGAMVAVVLAGGGVGALDLWAPGKPPPPSSSAAAFARIGPDGTAHTFFGDDLRNEMVPRSRAFDLCVGEMRLKRPSMLTTGMPDAFCTVTRSGKKGPWRISTGGWQECQAVCARLRP